MERFERRPYQSYERRRSDDYNDRSQDDYRPPPPPRHFEDPLYGRESTYRRQRARSTGDAYISDFMPAMMPPREPPLSPILRQPYLSPEGAQPYYRHERSRSVGDYGDGPQIYLNRRDRERPSVRIPPPQRYDRHLSPDTAQPDFWRERPAVYDEETVIYESRSSPPPHSRESAQSRPSRERPRSSSDIEDRHYVANRRRDRDSSSIRGPPSPKYDQYLSPEAAQPYISIRRDRARSTGEAGIYISDDQPPRAHQPSYLSSEAAELRRARERSKSIGDEPSANTRPRSRDARGHGSPIPVLVTPRYERVAPEPAKIQIERKIPRGAPPTLQSNVYTVTDTLQGVRKFCAKNHNVPSVCKLDGRVVESEHRLQAWASEAYTDSVHEDYPSYRVVRTANTVLADFNKRAAKVANESSYIKDPSSLEGISVTAIDLDEDTGGDHHTSLPYVQHGNAYERQLIVNRSPWSPSVLIEQDMKAMELQALTLRRLTRTLREAQAPEYTKALRAHVDSVKRRTCGPNVGARFRT